MYIYVCVSVCVYIRVCVSVCIYTYVCLCVYIYMCVSVCVHIHVCVHVPPVQYVHTVDMYYTGTCVYLCTTGTRPLRSRKTIICYMYVHVHTCVQVQELQVHGTCTLRYIYRTQLTGMYTCMFV